MVCQIYIFDIFKARYKIFLRTLAERISEFVGPFLEFGGSLKRSKSQASPLQATSQERKRKKPPKLVFELLGPCGKFFAQARTADQAKGVYLAAFPALPRDLECVYVKSIYLKPICPYHIIQSKRKGPCVALRYP